MLFYISKRCFEPHRRHCVVSSRKHIYLRLVLVQPWKNRLNITEILLTRTLRIKSNKQNKQTVQTLMKCRHMRHFIWALTVCRSTCYEQGKHMVLQFIDTCRTHGFKRACTCKQPLLLIETPQQCIIFVKFLMRHFLWVFTVCQSTFAVIHIECRTHGSKRARGTTARVLR